MREKECVGGEAECERTRGRRVEDWEKMRGGGARERERERVRNVFSYFVMQLE